MKLLLTTILISTLALIANAQKIEVSQEYLDASVKAFQEVKASRDLITQLQSAHSADDKLIEQQTLLIESFKRLTESQGGEIAALREIIRLKSCSESALIKIGFLKFGYRRDCK